MTPQKKDAVLYSVEPFDTDKAVPDLTAKTPADTVENYAKAAGRIYNQIRLQPLGNTLSDHDNLSAPAQTGERMAQRFESRLSDGDTFVTHWGSHTDRIARDNWSAPSHISTYEMSSAMSTLLENAYKYTPAYVAVTTMANKRIIEFESKTKLSINTHMAQFRADLYKGTGCDEEKATLKALNKAKRLESHGKSQRLLARMGERIQDTGQAVGLTTEATQRLKQRILAAGLMPAGVMRSGLDIGEGDSFSVQSTWERDPLGTDTDPDSVSWVLVDEHRVQDNDTPQSTPDSTKGIQKDK